MDELYRDYILDHYKNPKNFGELPEHDLEFHDRNPLCGDEMELHIAPIILGKGERLFDDLGASDIKLELMRTVAGPGVTHIKYRMVK